MLAVVAPPVSNPVKVALVIAVAQGIRRRAYAQERLTYHVSKYRKRLAEMRYIAETHSEVELDFSCAPSSETLDYIRGRIAAM